MRSGLAAIDLAALYQSGKRLVLLDVDNTLLPWRSEDIPAATLDWLAAGRAAGMRFCIISNTRHPARLERLAKKMELPFLLGKKKPHPESYLKAIEQFEVSTAETVMVGDQIFTDIRGANRAGIDSIWIEPCADVDFVGAKLLRPVEKALRRVFLRSVMEVR